MLNQDNILFIRLRLLGDIVFTIPAIQMFTRQFPDKRIYYVVEEKFKEVAALIPGVFKLIVVPRKMGLKDMWNFRKEMKKIGFDTAVDFHSGPKSAQLTFLSGAKTRIGYKTPNRNWAYTARIPRKFALYPTHSCFNQAKLLEPLGIKVGQDNIPPYPVPSIPEKLVCSPLLELVKKNGNKKSVVIHVGAGNEFRDWGTDKFSQLIERLTNEQVVVYLIGSGNDEKQKGAYFAQRFPLEDLTGQLSIAELFFLIQRSSVYLGADSGPLHLASLTTTPIVALYGPNLPEISGPWRKTDVKIMQKQMECRPCNQRKCIYGIIPCMKTISTDDVYEAITRYF